MPVVQLQPRLIETRVPEDPEGVVLVLHGGGARRAATAVSPTQLSVLRMIPIARRIARRGRGRLAVYRLLNAQRGWDTEHTPVHDARWALQEIASRLGGLPPSCLVGHSLGGRAALLAAGDPAVRSVVALAPWVYPDDAPPGLADRRILVVHGDQDRIAAPQRSSTVARDLARRNEVGYVSVAGGKHAMLRHREHFDGLAAEFAATTLLGDEPDAVLARLASGESWLAV